VLLRASWSLTVAWLALCLFGQGYFAWLWFVDPLNPIRNEALMGLIMVTFYALPGFAVLAFLRWRFWEQSPQPFRVAAIALSALLVSIFLFFLVST
jgi:hypothetical protein